MTGYRLRLEFGGLCLFVHEPAAGKMHVLLPREHDHQPTLTHNADSVVHGKPPGDTPHNQPVPGKLITLTGLDTATPLGPPPPEVADLDGICPPVPPTLLGDKPGPEVACRVTFDAGVSLIAPCGEGALFDFQGTRQLPIRIVWEMQIDDDGPLVIHLEGLNGSGAGKPIELHPHNGELNVWIFNSPQAHLPVELPPRTKRPVGTPSAGHFQAFYTMLGCAGTIIPVFVGPPPDTSADCYVDAVDAMGEAARVGLDVTCIAARAPLA
jgi:hypothetical protein